MIKVFKTKQAASEAMAKAFRTVALEAVDTLGQFTVALTGGRSPRLLYETLHLYPYRETIPWEQTYVFWGDERAVPFDDERNNAKMAFDTLLNYIPLPEENIFRINSEIPPQEAADEYETIIKEHFKNEEPVFDLILLGMGSDGHTASIFPGSEVIQEHERWISTGFNAEQDTQRITMTPPLLNKARHIFFSVFGEEKAETLRDVHKNKYNPHVLPVQLIKPVSGEVTWFVDKEAAKFIDL
ncbi:6-phosphogluconolactonase [Aliifodinibius sp. S!AR15-10]|nr:6-phosphogluconolactonase [Aliifodinibius sp. S!AR15-10]